MTQFASNAEKKEKFSILFSVADQCLDAYGFDKNGHTIERPGLREFSYQTFTELWVWMRDRRSNTPYTPEYHETVRTFRSTLEQKNVSDKHLNELASLFGITRSDLGQQTLSTFLRKGTIEDLCQKLEGHKIPPYAYQPKEASLILVDKDSQNPSDASYAPLLNVGMYIPSQNEEMTPNIAAQAPDISIIEPGKYSIKYGFKDVRINVSFPHSKGVSLDFSRKPIFSEEGYEIKPISLPRTPSFHISARKSDHEIVKDINIYNIGKLLDVKPGDQVAVDLIVNIDKDDIHISGGRFENTETKMSDRPSSHEKFDLDDQTNEILTMLLRGELRTAAVSKDVELNAGQLAVLTSYRGVFENSK